MGSRSCIRCGDYIPGGGVEICDKCIAEIQNQGKFKKLFISLLATAILAGIYYYIWFK